MKRMHIFALSAAAAIGFVSCTPGDGGHHDAVTPPPAVTSGSFADVVERVAPSVVTVRVENENGGGIGSGVVLQTDVIVTNQHVVKQQTSVVLHYADGLQSKGTVLASDAKTDLAVVKTDRKNLPVPRWRDGLPRTGDQVLAIGSPLGFENTVTAGIVSGLHRQLPGEQGDSMSDLLQTDAPISPGNSGGALLDVQGRVIGISEAYIPPSAGAVSLGFAIPSPAAKDVADQLLKSGKVDHPYLGVSLGSLTPSIRQQLGIKTESGAIVLGVDPRGPAAAAGIRVGDVIIKFGDTDVHGPDDILSALRKAKPGQAVPVRVVRGDKVTDLKVTLAGR